MDPVRERLAGAGGGLGRRARVALIAAGAAALLVVGAVVSGVGASGSSGDVPVVATHAPAAASPSPTPLLVQVAGAVHRPGVVALAAGARVLDAITAAGGATSKADVSAVNLAAKVVDGQRVDVPVRGVPPVATTAGAAPDAPISLSTATEAQLETLPRIGPAMAARIIAYRDAHGGFGAVSDLQQVAGIGPATYAGLKDLVVP